MPIGSASRNLCGTEKSAATPCVANVLGMVTISEERDDFQTASSFCAAVKSVKPDLKKMMSFESYRVPKRSVKNGTFNSKHICNKNKVQPSTASPRPTCP